jgi:hypothetical protein
VRRWAGRLMAAVFAAALLLMVRVQVAAAAPMGGSGQLGQTPPTLSWIQLTDSHGISVWNFEMSLDRGGVTSPDKFFWASVVDGCWGAYRSWCALALWFLDWVLSFDWLHVIAAPMLSTGAALQSVVDRIGAVPTLLTICAIVAVGWMIQGRYVTGIWELAVSLVIASLATGVFAAPVQMVAGQDGLIMKAQNTGLQLSGELAAGQSGGTSDPIKLRQQMTGQLVDTFVRQPTEMINFGRVLDGDKCEKTYNDVLAQGPYGSASTIRDKVGACDAALGDYASQPSAGMALGSMIFMPASLVILLLAAVLGGSVIAAACYALFQSLKMILALVTALLPGEARGSLFVTVAETAISLLIIIFTTVFLGVFLLVIQEMFKASAASSVPRTFVIVDILLVVGVLIYWRERKRLKESAQRFAQWMSKRPGGASATRLPERGGAGIGALAGRALSTASQVSMLQARRVSRRAGGAPSVYNVDARRQGVFGFSRPGDEQGSTIDMTAGPGPGGPGGRGSPKQLGPGPAGGSSLSRIGARKSGVGRAVAGTLVRAGTNAALAYATGGASTIVSGTMTASRAGKAVNAAMSVRRAAVVGRLALGAGSSGSTPRGSAIAMPAGKTQESFPPGRQTKASLGDGTSSASDPAPKKPAPTPVSGTPAKLRKTPATSAPTGSARGGRSRRAPMSRQWDKVVRDGQVIFVPRPPPQPSDPPPATGRARRSQRGR